MFDEDSLRARYLRRSKFAVGLLVILAIPAIVHSHAAIETLYNHPSDWVPDSIGEKVEFNDFVEHFAVTNLLMIAWDGSDIGSSVLQQVTDSLRPLSKADMDAESQANLELPGWLANEINEIREICGTNTPLNFVRSGDETLSRLTSVPVNLSNLQAIARLQGTLVGKDGQQTCMVLSLTEQSSERRRILVPKIREIVSRIVNRPVAEIAIVGAPLEGAMVDLESIRSIRVFTPPSAILAALLCLVCLRSIWLTAAIVAVAVIGEGMVMAAVYYTGVPMNAVLIVLPPLVFVLTVSAGIHLSNYFLDAAREFPKLSLTMITKTAMKAGTTPCALAAGTTVVGLCSLLLVRLEPVRIFGAIASIGVVATLGMLLLLLPGAMLLSRPNRGIDESSNEIRNHLRSKADRWMRRQLIRPWPIIGLFVSITLILSLGLARLESTVNIPRMFLPNSDLRTQYQWFEQHVGPISTGDLLLKFPLPNDQDDPLERLAVVAQIHHHLIKEDVVGGAMSAMTFIPPMPHGHSLSATAQRSVIRQLITDPASSLGQLGFIARDDKREMWRIHLCMPQHERADFGADIAAIENAVSDKLAEIDLPVESSLTGHIVIVQRSQELLLQDLFRSFITAFGVIAAVMMLMLRSVIGGLLAMAPNLFPTVAMFGLMGLLEIPLDIGSVMTASVALGIAVDDTVHLLSRFGSRRKRGLGQIHAAIGALHQCGWAMFHTTFVCGVSLMVYWFSPFVPTSQFALLMFGLLTSALLGVLLLLPALMATRLGHFLAHTIGSDASATVYADQPPADIRRLPTRYQSSQL